MVVAFTSSRQKHGQKVFPNLRRGDVLLLPHMLTVEKKMMNTYNSVNVIGKANLPCINVHTKCSSNKPVTLYKETDTESSTSINEENMDDNNASEEIASH